MHPPHLKLPDNLYKSLTNAYKCSIYQLKRIVYQVNPEFGTNDPYYYLLENIINEIERFAPIDSHMEFNRMLA